jgi:Ca2+-transporting ATPase
MMYILSVHIPIAGLSLIPVLLKWPLILFPVHIVFLELIIDPACTLIFEADKDDKDVMRRKPRRAEEKLFNFSALLKCLLQGGLALAVTIGVYMFVSLDHPAEAARALAFLTLVVCNLGMILSNRSFSRSCIGMLKEKNEAFKWVMTGTIGVMCLIMTLPFFKELFRFGNVSATDLMLSLAGGVIAVALMELLKLIPSRGR